MGFLRLEDARVKWWASNAANECQFIPQRVKMFACCVCGSDQFLALYDNTLRRCWSCGHVTANMCVNKELLRSVYSEKYFAGEEYVNYLEDKWVLQSNFSRRLQRLSGITRFTPGETVIEIGCAYGFFGELLLRRYPFVSYVGFEVVPEACQYGRQHFSLDIRCGDFLTLPDVPRCSHAFMWDVIEHLNAPQLYIEKISSLLQNNGKVYITTGDIDAFLPRWQGKKWRMIHPPSHLQYFSRKTLSLLLERYGLKTIHVSYPSTARSMRQIFFSLFLLKRRRKRWLQQIYRLIPRTAGVSVNTFDIMLVVAEKA